MSLSKRFGPGLLVTAAFIGPGTVTTATLAGVRFGLSLLWVLVFAAVATIALQEMAARLGLVTRGGLGESLRGTFAHPAARTAVIVLVIGAIGMGNAAFQTGNITGAAMGLEVISGVRVTAWNVGISLVAAVLLWFGTYRVLERVLIALVGLMSVVFVVTAVMVGPEPDALVKGLLTPTVPEGSLTTVIALIGTTVVPYNLFLHASAVCRKWPADADLPSALRESRIDTALSVGLGGVITLAIVVAASAFHGQAMDIKSAADMAHQLSPVLGDLAEPFFAVGLAAAGLTSAITAPLAAGYAVSGVLGRAADRRAWSFRIAWMVVLVIGAACAVVAGASPVETIVFAQAANGIILPLIAVFLLIAVNRRGLLGRHANGTLANVVGIVVVLWVTGLAAYKLTVLAARG